MPSLPRIITVDPLGTIAQHVRGALDLMDRLVIQIDVPSALDALEEAKRGNLQLVVSAWEPGDGMQGWELAAKLKQIAPDIAIVIVADYDDTELDDEIRSASPFVYFKRPFEVAQFLRVLGTALEGGDIFQAARPPESASTGKKESYSPVPDLNIERAKEIIHRLMTDLNAPAVLLMTREAQVLVEQGALGYLKRDELARRISPAVIANVELREMLGGNATTLQFYDGDDYDVYVLSVGLHHFMAVVFDGQRGARELGAVSRYGRRASEDLIALLGADAWFIQRMLVQDLPEMPKESSAQRLRRTVAPKSNREEEDVIVLERATITSTPEVAPALVEEPKLAAIEGELDLDLLFAGGGEMLDADDLFSLDKIEQLSRDDERSGAGKIGWDQARELGLLDS